VYEVWAAISQLPYTDRFCLYSDLKVGPVLIPLAACLCRWQGCRMSHSPLHAALQRARHCFSAHPARPLSPLSLHLQEGARSSPLLTASGKLAETEVRRILRRVTAPANKKEAKATMKPLGRMLAKIAHAAPLPVAEQLIRQVCVLVYSWV
jgi:THO complex subunit 2